MMRILGLIDLSIKEDLMDKAVKEILPEAEVRYIKWPTPTPDVLTKENLNIEKNGPEAALPIPGLLELIKEFNPEVIMTQFAPVTGEVIEKAQNLEMIGCLRGGVDNVNLKAATKKNILVFNNSGRTANAVAEFTLGHMLSVSRNIGMETHLLMNREWKRPETKPSEMYGCTVGLIGFGNISQKLSERLHGFKVKILAYDPYVSDDILTQYGAKRVELKELLRESDFISLHSRLTAETKNMIGKEEFKLMKPTAYLINTARADLIEKDALIDALQTKQIRGAALDVFWQEPLRKDDPLLNFTNISITPHLAGSTVQTEWLTISLFLSALKEFLKTHQSRSIVNFKPAEQIKIAENMKLVKSVR